MVKLQAGEFEQAIQICSSLIGNNGVTPLALYVLGVSQYRLGEREKAVNSLLNSIRFNEKNQGAWKILGEIYLSQDKISEANACLKRVWELSERQSSHS